LAQFKVHFKQAVSTACAVYPDARVDIDSTGLLLHPSRPPVVGRNIVALPRHR
jgi:hypothetical protein